jgi:hypothetical protein
VENWRRAVTGLSTTGAAQTPTISLTLALIACISASRSPVRPFATPRPRLARSCAGRKILTRRKWPMHATPPKRPLSLLQFSRQHLSFSSRPHMPYGLKQHNPPFQACANSCELLLPPRILSSLSVWLHGPVDLRPEIRGKAHGTACFVGQPSFTPHALRDAVYVLLLFPRRRRGRLNCRKQRKLQDSKLGIRFL